MDLFRTRAQGDPVCISLFRGPPQATAPLLAKDHPWSLKQKSVAPGGALYAGAQEIGLPAEIEREMLKAAEGLDFERAAALRDQLKDLKDLPKLVIAGSRKKKSTFVKAKKKKIRDRASSGRRKA